MLCSFECATDHGRDDCSAVGEVLEVLQVIGCVVLGLVFRLGRMTPPAIGADPPAVRAGSTLTVSVVP